MLERPGDDVLALGEMAERSAVQRNGCEVAVLDVRARTPKPPGAVMYLAAGTSVVGVEAVALRQEVLQRPGLRLELDAVCCELRAKGRRVPAGGERAAGLDVRMVVGEAVGDPRRLDEETAGRVEA